MIVSDRWCEQADYCSGQCQQKGHRHHGEDRRVPEPVAHAVGGVLPSDQSAAVKTAEHESAEQNAVSHLAHDETRPAGPMQLTIFTPLSQKIVDRIKETDLDRLSPLEALNLLASLKKEIE